MDAEDEEQDETCPGPFVRNAGHPGIPTCTTLSVCDQDDIDYCGTCLSAFRAGLGDFLYYNPRPHHDTLQSLRTSAESGCVNCCRLFSIAQTHGGSDALSPYTMFDSTYVTNRATRIEFMVDNETSRGPFVYYHLLKVTTGDYREGTPVRTAIPIGRCCRDQQPVSTIFGSRSGSDQTWDWIQHWVKRCDEHHSSCNRAMGRFQYPTRLIDVGNDFKNPQLCRTDVPSWDHQERYTTLSHCWGSDSSRVFQLRTANADQLHEKLDLDALSQTFKDAIEITRRLQIRYLWIDSLCIIQDDDDDWKHEAANMSQIYSNTYLNISATSARDGSEGCFRDRDSKTLAAVHIHPDDEKAFPIALVVPSGMWRDYVDDAPLNKRAWVLQERLLSPRVLHFSTHQVFWECREHYACETFPLTVPIELRVEYTQFTDKYLRDWQSTNLIGKRSDSEILTLWFQIVRAYSQASLTFDKDKLVALSGVARKFATVWGLSYAAGLWEQDLTRSLLWTTGGESYRYEKYVAPSWSWASVAGPISNYITTNDVGRLVHVLEVEIDTVPPNDPFGQVIGGWVRLRGKVLAVSWDYSPCRRPFPLSDFVLALPSGTEIGHSETYQVKRELDVWPDSSENLEHRQGFLFPVKHDSVFYTGILLRAVPEAQGIFSRVGYFSLNDSGVIRLLETFPESIVTII